LGLFDYFRRSPPIRDAAALDEFIDQQTSFLAQKGIYEYARARAGHYAKVLFHEATFQAAADESRWRAYPLCLAMVTELVEGVLAPNTTDRPQLLAALRSLTLSVFDRYPVPDVLGPQVWTEERRELVRRLDMIAMHPPKRAIDIAIPWAQAYFDLMPIHEKLRGRDFLTTQSYLRVTLANIHDELIKRMDLPALLTSLDGGNAD
jgi:hypothetical protein